MELMNENKKMQQLISSTLRVGVMTACCIAILSGTYYLICHGSEPIPNYYTFHGEPSSLTSLSGIFTGVFHFEAANWIQLGVLVMQEVILNLFLLMQLKKVAVFGKNSMLKVILELVLNVCLCI